MIFDVCLECEYHEVDERNDSGYCNKPTEQCYCAYSKCIWNKAAVEFEERHVVKSIHLINKAKHGRS